jgi:nickel/cobalt transporter (NicO) family protein
MTGELFYLASSFWLGALHAATPGHGKTIAAAYIVGARGRPVDALVLGIFVTLSHTSGIVLVAVLATLGSAWFVPHRIEAYLAVVTGLLVIGIGLWLVRAQWRAMPNRPAPHGHDDQDDREGGRDPHGLATPSDLHEPSHQGDAHEYAHPAAHGHAPQGDPHHHGSEVRGGYHRHGLGPTHTHDLPLDSANRPSLAILLGLGIAGGLLPDPGALAVLLAALASGKVMLGLFTVLLFSLGFASVLVLVGIIAARVGSLVLAWLDSRWMSWLQVGTAALIVLVGVVLTVNAVRTVTGLSS